MPVQRTKILHAVIREIFFETGPALGRLGGDAWFGWYTCIPSFVHCFFNNPCNNAFCAYFRTLFAFRSNPHMKNKCVVSGYNHACVLEVKVTMHIGKVMSLKFGRLEL